MANRSYEFNGLIDNPPKTYFVDHRRGNDKKGDGLTPETAYKTLRHGYFREPFPTWGERLLRWINWQFDKWFLYNLNIGTDEETLTQADISEKITWKELE